MLNEENVKKVFNEMNAILTTILVRMNFDLVSAKLFIRLAIIVTFLAKPSSIIGTFAWD